MMSSKPCSRWSARTRPDIGALSMRAFDATMATLGLVVLSPLLLLAALGIKLDSAGPVFFEQERVGLNGKRFKILKFRTMTVDAELRGGQLTRQGDARVTRVGRILRRSKIDELAQLFNVVIGDMALVGPRPEVPRYVALYDSEQGEVLRVRPGITDPASIVYRNESEVLGSAADPEAFYVTELFPRKLSLSLAYVQRRSFWLDIGVLARTAQCLVFPDAAARGMLRSLGVDPSEHASWRRSVSQGGRPG